MLAKTTDIMTETFLCFLQTLQASSVTVPLLGTMGPIEEVSQTNTVPLSVGSRSSRFHLKTEAESCLRNIVILNKRHDG
jgi:hypothetical protein